MTFRADWDYLHELIVHNIPLVTVDSAVPRARCLVVEVDYRFGIDQAIQHLALLGHRRIGFVSGPLEHFTNQARRDAFLESVRKVGLRPEDTPIYEGDHTFEAGAAAIRHFLSLKNPPTAILSSNDLSAVGVLRGLSERRMRVPEEISVIGFDDIHMAEFAHPPLSTVRMSREDLAAAAFEGLMRLTQHPSSPAPEPIRVKTQLVIRQSTGPRTSDMGARSGAAGAPPESH